ncbi:DUF512 domain-containing protein [Ruminococcaceae bacterium OttesenSCG-928-L11]|nr:DUF512 domain-containing protein [Ruminococcaceae bacterium OttesenSCG-928-L11]
MSVRIDGIEQGSIAAKKGIQAGDTLVAINGHDIRDVLDYRFYMTDSRLELHLCREGAPYTLRIRKPEYDDLGLEFDTYLMDEQKSCRNKCCFCFIDQMPPGMRDTLYFKDDDARLSFLFGNYITLTNLTDEDVQRIITMHISPVNISIHTTNPELRVKMMKNPRSGEVLRYIPQLCEAGIKVNGQLVLCPDINDGDELIRSLTDLSAYGDTLQSVSCVPVGLTKYREGLFPQRSFTPEEAAAVIDTIDRFGAQMRETHGNRVFFAADEFYLTAGRPVPPYEYYEDFFQLENGVGMLTLLEYEFMQALEDAEPAPMSRSVTMVTGTAAFPLIKALAAKATDAFPGLSIQVIPIRNDFFGETITVAGLVCGQDIIKQLEGVSLGDEVLFPAAMLRHDRDLFLDDVSVQDLAQALGHPVRPTENDGYELLAAMLGGQC